VITFFGLAFFLIITRAWLVLDDVERGDSIIKATLAYVWILGFAAIVTLCDSGYFTHVIYWIMGLAFVWFGVRARCGDGRTHRSPAGVFVPSPNGVNTGGR
jgi:hypothetical protein